MKHFCLCLACCCMLVSHSQSRFEQLKGIIASASFPYKQKISAYISLSDSFGLQNFNEWLRLSKEGSALARSKGDSVSLGTLTRGTGEAFYFKGMYDSAAHYLYASVRILEKEAAPSEVAKTYNALAKLYRKTRDLSRSSANYDKAFAVYKQTNDSAGMAMIWNESGVVYEYAKDYKTAIERYTASLNMDRSLGDSIGVAYALSNIAGVYVLQSKFAPAEANLLQALAVRKKLNDTFSICLNYSDLASAYLASTEYAKARLYADSSNAITQKMGYAELRQSNFDLLAQIAEATGNFKAAYDYQKQRASLKDSIFNLEKTKQIEELNTQYETIKKEQKIEEQKHQIEQQSIILIASALLSIALFLLGYSFYRRKQLKQKAEMQLTLFHQQQAATKAVMEAEEAERQRIAKDLHDGIGQMMSAAKMNLSAYEHIAAFSSQQEKQKFSRIIQLVDESCTEVRAVAHNMMPNALLKNSLAAAIREFISKLDQQKLAAHLYTEGLDERLDANVETVLYRVIQECVNNVIKHAGATTLDITVVKEGKEITATVEDNGKGFDTSKGHNNEGMGFKNIRTRIEYLKGTVEVDSAPGRGTLVALHVPL